MKKLFSILLLSMVCAVAARAQVVMSTSFMRDPESEVKIKLLDSLTSQPLVMATVYLQPKGDTTIMYFNLTDTSGVAVLGGVVTGSYKLTAEYLGYKPFVKEYYFKNRNEELGTVKMVEDAIVLEGAKVSAVGNAIEIKKDTLIYNATMFRTSDNAVLGELLRKMPGFEVSSNGQVKVNGQDVSKITVNGKTFFFDDPTMAVKNLPAKIVDKIKITDAKSDAEKSTGIADMASQQTKEMDISFKKEYKEGWFGNAKLAAGAPIAPESDETGMMVGGKDFMYNGNVLLSGYNEKDQITLIGNGYNTPNVGANDMIMVAAGAMAGGRSRPMGGLTTGSQLGANINTSRLKGLNTSAMANYKGTLVESETVSQKQTFNGESPDIFSTSHYKDNYNEDGITMSVELANVNQNKVYARIVPKIEFSKVKRDSYTQGSTSMEENLLNTSNSISYLESEYFMHRTDAYITFMDLGKKRRSLTVSSNFNLSNDNSQNKEYSSLIYAASGENSVKNLYYKSDAQMYGYYAAVTYVEPIAKYWDMSAIFRSKYSSSTDVRKAYKPDVAEGFNPWFGDKNNYSVLDEYYSSVSEYSYLSNAGNLLFQYSKGNTTAQFGATVEVVNNENYNKSYGIEQTTGKGEYLWNYAPFVRFSLNAKNGSDINLNYSGNSSALSSRQLSSVPDISNPSNISIGNVYLHTPFRNNLSVSYGYNNRKNFSYISADLNFANSIDEIVYANWFDSKGVQYNVPVNSRKGSNSARLWLYVNSIPLNKEKTLKFGVNVMALYTVAYSYQNLGKSESIDMNTFNYSDFMKDFWGSANGDKFYRGESGFKESRTNNAKVSVNTTIAYKGDRFEVSLSEDVSRNIIKYSLNKNANMNTWTSSTFVVAEYMSDKKFNIVSDMNYVFYRGYNNGYGEPAFKWNVEAYKSVKAFTFGFKVKDILNQTTNFNRTTTATYIEDSYRNVIGRHFLFTLTFNFGKMNSGKSQSANMSMINMML